MSVAASSPERITTRLAVEPLENHFPKFAQALGHRSIYLIRADMAGDTGAFKEYGVREVVSDLAERGHTRVSTASAGSHALALIKFGAHYGLEVDLSLPATIPPEKEARMYNLWSDLGQAQERLHIYKQGANFQEADTFATDHFDLDTYIHPYNNLQVIQGRMQVYHDARKALPAMTDIVVPIGGGSLIAAVATAAQAQGHVVAWGVEAAGSNSTSKTLRAQSAHELPADSPNTRYGGSAVTRMGSHAHAMLAQINGMPERIVGTSDSDVIALAREYTEHEPGMPLEPTSLVAVAGLREILARATHPGVIGVVATGHNESYRNLLR